jgi:Peptidase family M23
LSEIDHRQAKNLIHATMSSSILEPDKGNLTQHLEACAACREYASQMNALEGNLRRSFHARWDAARGPSPWVIDAIYKKRRVYLMVKKIFGFTTSAITIGVLTVIVIFAFSFRPMQSVPLSGGQPVQTRMPDPETTKPPVPTPEWEATRLVGPGACQNPPSNYPGTGTFIWPTTLQTIAGYDYLPAIQHFGIDLAGNQGDQVFASDGGVVVFAGWNVSGYGNTVVIDHGNGIKTLYAHLSSLDTSCGEQLDQGNPVGKIGSTGNISGTWLHFEMIVNNEQVNPAEYLPSP